jgi:hypothetical protein
LAGLVVLQTALFGILWWPRGERLVCGTTCPPQVLAPGVTYPGQIIWHVAAAAVIGFACLCLATRSLSLYAEREDGERPIVGHQSKGASLDESATR